VPLGRAVIVKVSGEMAGVELPTVPAQPLVPMITAIKHSNRNAEAYLEKVVRTNLSPLCVKVPSETRLVCTEGPDN
jgi:hypothetical protein